MAPSFVQNILPAKTYNAAKALALSAGVALLGVVVVLLVGYVAASPTFGWTGLCKCLGEYCVGPLLTLA